MSIFNKGSASGQIATMTNFAGETKINGGKTNGGGMQELLL